MFKLLELHVTTIYILVGNLIYLNYLKIIILWKKDFLLGDMPCLKIFVVVRKRNAAIDSIIIIPISYKKCRVIKNYSQGTPNISL